MIRLNIITIVLLFSLGTSPLYAVAITKFKEKREMTFGGIIADPAGDVIRIRPNSRVTAQNNSYFFGQADSGRFTARGDANAAVSITLSSGNSLTGPGASMSLDNLYHNKGSTPAFNSRGRITIKIGGYLTINPAQAEGEYSGTYTIFLDYQ